MSELSAFQCGCNERSCRDDCGVSDCGNNNGCGCDSIIFIILILCCCGGGSFC